LTIDDSTLSPSQKIQDFVVSVGGVNRTTHTTKNTYSKSARILSFFITHTARLHEQEEVDALTDHLVQTEAAIADTTQRYR
jgi:hypothetical protein